MKLDDLKVYSLAMQLGECVWKIVLSWDYFQKDTEGKQWIRAIDSVAANLSEGNGRFHIKEAKNFTYFSRGSLAESKTWLLKAYNRKLITEDQFRELLSKTDQLGKMLNSYINSLGKHLIHSPDETQRRTS